MKTSHTPVAPRYAVGAFALLLLAGCNGPASQATSSSSGSSAVAVVQAVGAASGGPVQSASSATSSPSTPPSSPTVVPSSGLRLPDEDEPETIWIFKPLRTFGRR